MLEYYKTIYQNGQGEIAEKKSKFIAHVRLAETEEDALAFIEEMKKQYWDASHNCFAYVIGEHREIVRCSDDGEPGGTAGRPMLDVLLGEELYDTAVVVTRYFGGTLLGTGGLVRAYSQAVKAALANSRVIEKQLGVLLHVQTDYSGVGKIQYQAGQRGLPVIDGEYTEAVNLKILVPLQQLDGFRQDITQATNGQARMQKDKELYFAQLDGEYLMF